MRDLSLAPEQRAALQYAVSLSADIELQLSKATGGGPVLELLAKARACAATAIVALAAADPETPKEIRRLQNEVTCFNRIVEWIGDIVKEGLDAGHALDDDEREDLAEAFGLSDDDADEMRRAGLPPEDID